MNSYAVHCRGTVHVPLPVAAAIELFTPEGERRWVPGWDPQYPARVSGREAGTVFTTRAGDRSTTWVIVESGEDVMRYARVVPGRQAGTVAVRCRADGRATHATVEYRSTALDPGAARELGEFAATFAATMVEWERRIEAAVSVDA